MSVKLYTYNGPVKQFDRVLDFQWRGETYAVTEKHARRNLTTQYRRQRGFANNTRIELTGKIECYEES